MDFGLIALGIYRILLCLKTGAVLSSLPLLSPEGTFLPVAAAILLLPAMGHFSDRIGQRKFILLSEAASALIFLGLPYLPQGIGSLVLLPVASLLVRIAYPVTLAGFSRAQHKGFVLGLVKSLSDIALLAGVVVGVSLPSMGADAVYALSGLVSLMLAPLGLFVPDARSKTRHGFFDGLALAMPLSLLAALVWQASGALAQNGWDSLLMQTASTPLEASLPLISAALVLGTTVSAGVLLDHHGLLSAWILMATDAALLAIAAAPLPFAMTGILKLAQLIPLSMQSILAPYIALSNKKAGAGLCLGLMGSVLLLAEVLVPTAYPFVHGMAGHLGVFWLAAIGALAGFMILKYY